MELRFSKSTYCKAVQCPKMLWLMKHHPELYDDAVEKQAIFNAGNEVGDLAMGLFGPYTEVPFDKDLTKMLTCTEELLSAGTPVICEASFSYDGCFCSVDILRNLGDGAVELYEVKSATELHEIYKHDVAYQVYVLSRLGYRVARACLVHINNRYVLEGELDLAGLFTIRDLTDLAMEMQPEVEERIRACRALVAGEEEPGVEIGEQCSYPYDCGFWGHCACHVPCPSVFDVSSLSKQKKWKLYREGIVSFRDIATAGALDGKYLQQVRFELEDRAPHIDADGIRGVLNKLSYPLYFLDFETFNPAIPLYQGTRPYMQIPFQYSLHYIAREGGPLCHTAFLAYPGQDPRRALAEQLVRDIPPDVCTTAYNMTFEKGVIRQLAKQFPDLAGHLMNIHDHIQDLMVPFQKRWYYVRAMQGSYSIKYVLPALYPDDPGLDYHALDGVHNGEEASDTFKRMATMGKDELEHCRGCLLAYCGLDTYAMVKVWEKLRQAVGDEVGSSES